jgi:acetyl esterase
MDAAFDTESYKNFAHGYFLTRKHMKWFWDLYAPDKSVRTEITASPLQATIEQLKDLPPALIITGEFDVLRDEGEAYAHKLTKAGVEVTATRYLGTIHGFVFLNDLSKTPAAVAAMEQATSMIKKVLHN